MGAGTSPWPRRLALATLLAALPLAVFGGTVTTLREGMAIDGWWVLDRGHGDYFLLAYPVERWFASAGTFVEHTHRLFGALVGLLSIAYVVAASLAPRVPGRAAWAWVGLLAVCAQGALGGFRVLENSPELAFLHGAFAQAVLALLAVNVVLCQPAWTEAAPPARERSASLRRSAKLAVAAVYAQIVLGAWLRHGGSDAALVAHVAFAALATGAVIALARGLRETGEARFGGQARRLLVLVVAQLALGLLALVAIFVVSGGFTATVSTAEAISATAHVLFGALLLQATVASAMWAHRDPAREAAAARAEGCVTTAAMTWKAAR
jgi:cytochrome c oxidase assembly protein subunit 15